jgi:hypothetical protein
VHDGIPAASRDEVTGNGGFEIEPGFHCLMSGSRACRLELGKLRSIECGYAIRILASH